MLRNPWNRLTGGRTTSRRIRTLDYRRLRLGLEPLEQRRLLSVYTNPHVCLPHDNEPLDTDANEVSHGMVVSHFSVKLITSDADAIKDNTVDSTDLTVTKGGNDKIDEGTDFLDGYGGFESVHPV